MLGCGVLANGFSRVRCTGCGDELLVAFSCKRRGVCPSCCARRSADAAAHLMDDVLPAAPYRQWTISFPIRLRWALPRDGKLCSEVLDLFIRTLFSAMCRRARDLKLGARECGAVTFIQRFGSALQLNVHFHVLVPEGVFDDSGTLLPLPPPEDAEVHSILEAFLHRLRALLERTRTVRPRGHPPRRTRCPPALFCPVAPPVSPERLTCPHRSTLLLHRRLQPARQHPGPPQRPTRPRETLPLWRARSAFARAPLPAGGRSSLLPDEATCRVPHSNQAPAAHLSETPPPLGRAPPPNLRRRPPHLPALRLYSPGAGLHLQSPHRPPHPPSPQPPLQPSSPSRRRRPPAAHLRSTRVRLKTSTFPTPAHASAPSTGTVVTGRIETPHDPRSPGPIGPSPHARLARVPDPRLIALSTETDAPRRRAGAGDSTRGGPGRRALESKIQARPGRGGRARPGNGGMVGSPAEQQIIRSAIPGRSSRSS